MIKNIIIVILGICLVFSVISNESKSKIINQATPEIQSRSQGSDNQTAIVFQTGNQDSNNQTCEAVQSENSSLKQTVQQLESKLASIVIDPGLPLSNKAAYILGIQEGQRECRSGY